jgi:hypothetical protein
LLHQLHDPQASKTTGKLCYEVLLVANLRLAPHVTRESKHLVRDQVCNLDIHNLILCAVTVLRQDLKILVSKSGYRRLEDTTSLENIERTKLQVSPNNDK